MPEHSIRALLLILVLAATQLSGCATNHQISAETLEYYKNRTVQLQSAGASVVGDGCILNSGLTGSYAYLDASVGYATQGAKAFADFLQTNKVPVFDTTVPFICGSIAGKDELKVLKNEESDYETVKLPILNSEVNSGSPEYVSAYLELLRKTASAKLTNIDLPPMAQEEPIDLSNDDVQIIKKHLKTKYVFVVSLGGAQVSFAKRFVVAAVTGIATAGLTGGSMFMQMVDTSTSESVAMVDLDSKRVLWKRSYVIPRKDPLEIAKTIQENGVLSAWAPSISKHYIFPVEIATKNKVAGIDTK